MQVRIAVLADYASISLGDKLNVLGIFSNILARAEPVVHSQMQLVMQFEFDSTEAGKKNVQILLQDQEGQELLQMNGEIAVPRLPRGESATINQILLLNNTNFPKFGQYEFRVVINGRLEATIPLTVRKAEESKLVA